MDGSFFSEVPRESSGANDFPPAALGSGAFGFTNNQLESVSACAVAVANAVAPIVQEFENVSTLPPNDPRLATPTQQSEIWQGSRELLHKSTKIKWSVSIRASPHWCMVRLHTRFNSALDSLSGDNDFTLFSFASSQQYGLDLIVPRPSILRPIEMPTDMEAFHDYVSYAMLVLQLTCTCINAIYEHNLFTGAGAATSPPQQRLDQSLFGFAVAFLKHPGEQARVVNARAPDENASLPRRGRRLFLNSSAKHRRDSFSPPWSSRKVRFIDENENENSLGQLTNDQLSAELTDFEWERALQYDSLEHNGSPTSPDRPPSLDRTPPRPSPDTLPPTVAVWIYPYMIFIEKRGTVVSREIVETNSAMLEFDTSQVMASDFPNDPLTEYAKLTSDKRADYIVNNGENVLHAPVTGVDFVWARWVFYNTWVTRDNVGQRLMILHPVNALDTSGDSNISLEEYLMSGSHAAKATEVTATDVQSGNSTHEERLAAIELLLNAPTHSLEQARAMVLQARRLLKLDSMYAHSSAPAAAANVRSEGHFDFCGVNVGLAPSNRLFVVDPNETDAAFKEIAESFMDTQDDIVAGEGFYKPSTSEELNGGEEFEDTSFNRTPKHQRIAEGQLRTPPAAESPSSSPITPETPAKTTESPTSQLEIDERLARLTNDAQARMRTRMLRGLVYTGIDYTRNKSTLDIEREAERKKRGYMYAYNMTPGGFTTRDASARPRAANFSFVDPALVAQFPTTVPELVVPDFTGVDERTYFSEDAPNGLRFKIARDVFARVLGGELDAPPTANTQPFAAVSSTSLEFMFNTYVRLYTTRAPTLAHLDFLDAHSLEVLMCDPTPTNGPVLASMIFKYTVDGGADVWSMPFVRYVVAPRCLLDWYCFYVLMSWDLYSDLIEACTLDNLARTIRSMIETALSARQPHLATWLVYKSHALIAWKGLSTLPLPTSYVSPAVAVATSARPSTDDEMFYQMRIARYEALASVEWLLNYDIVVHPRVLKSLLALCIVEDKSAHISAFMAHLAPKDDDTDTWVRYFTPEQLQSACLSDAHSTLSLLYKRAPSLFNTMALNTFVGKLFTDNFYSDRRLQTIAWLANTLLANDGGTLTSLLFLVYLLRKLPNEYDDFHTVCVEAGYRFATKHPAWRDTPEALVTTLVEWSFFFMEHSSQADLYDDANSVDSESSRKEARARCLLYAHAARVLARHFGVYAIPSHFIDFMVGHGFVKITKSFTAAMRGIYAARKVNVMAPSDWEPSEDAVTIAIIHVGMRLDDYTLDSSFNLADGGETSSFLDTGVLDDSAYVITKQPFTGSMNAATNPLRKVFSYLAEWPKIFKAKHANYFCGVGLVDVFLSNEARAMPSANVTYRVAMPSTTSTNLLADTTIEHFKRHARVQGDLVDQLKWIYETTGVYPDQDGIDAAIMNGCVRILEWLFGTVLAPQQPGPDDIIRAIVAEQALVVRFFVLHYPRVTYATLLSLSEEKDDPVAVALYAHACDSVARPFMAMQVDMRTNHTVENLEALETLDDKVLSLMELATVVVDPTVTDHSIPFLATLAVQPTPTPTPATPLALTDVVTEPVAPTVTAAHLTVTVLPSDSKTFTDPFTGATTVYTARLHMRLVPSSPNDSSTTTVLVSDLHPRPALFGDAGDARDYLDCSTPVAMRANRLASKKARIMGTDTTTPTEAVSFDNEESINGSAALSEHAYNEEFKAWCDRLNVIDALDDASDVDSYTRVVNMVSSSPPPSPSPEAGKLNIGTRTRKRARRFIEMSAHAFFSQHAKFAPSGADANDASSMDAFTLAMDDGNLLDPPPFMLEDEHRREEERIALLEAEADAQDQAAAAAVDESVRARLQIESAEANVLITREFARNLRDARGDVSKTRRALVANPRSGITYQKLQYYGLLVLDRIYLFEFARAFDNLLDFFNVDAEAKMWQLYEQRYGNELLSHVHTRKDADTLERNFPSMPTEHAVYRLKQLHTLGYYAFSPTELLRSELFQHTCKSLPDVMWGRSGDFPRNVRVDLDLRNLHSAARFVVDADLIAPLVVGADSLHIKLQNTDPYYPVEFSGALPPLRHLSLEDTSAIVVHPNMAARPFSTSLQSLAFLMRIGVGHPTYARSDYNANFLLQATSDELPSAEERESVPARPLCSHEFMWNFLRGLKRLTDLELSTAFISADYLVRCMKTNSPLVSYDPSNIRGLDSEPQLSEDLAGANVPKSQHSTHRTPWLTFPAQLTTLTLDFRFAHGAKTSVDNALINSLKLVTPSLARMITQLTVANYRWYTESYGVNSEIVQTYLTSHHHLGDFRSLKKLTIVPRIEPSEIWTNQLRGHLSGALPPKLTSLTLRLLPFTFVRRQVFGTQGRTLHDTLQSLRLSWQLGCDDSTVDTPEVTLDLPVVMFAKFERLKKVEFFTERMVLDEVVHVMAPLPGLENMNGPPVPQTLLQHEMRRQSTQRVRLNMSGSLDVWRATRLGERLVSFTVQDLYSASMRPCDFLHAMPSLRILQLRNPMLVTTADLDAAPDFQPNYKGVLERVWIETPYRRAEFEWLFSLARISGATLRELVLINYDASDLGGVEPLELGDEFDLTSPLERLERHSPLLGELSSLSRFMTHLDTFVYHTRACHMVAFEFARFMQPLNNLVIFDFCSTLNFFRLPPEPLAGSTLDMQRSHDLLASFGTDTWTAFGVGHEPALLPRETFRNNTKLRHLRLLCYRPRDTYLAGPQFALARDIFAPLVELRTLECAIGTVGENANVIASGIDFSMLTRVRRISIHAAANSLANEPASEQACETFVARSAWPTGQPYERLVWTRAESEAQRFPRNLKPFLTACQVVPLSSSVEFPTFAFSPETSDKMPSKRFNGSANSPVVQSTNMAMAPMFLMSGAGKRARGELMGDDEMENNMGATKRFNADSQNDDQNDDDVQDAVAVVEEPQSVSNFERVSVVPEILWRIFMDLSSTYEVWQLAMMAFDPFSNEKFWAAEAIERRQFVQWFNRPSLRAELRVYIAFIRARRTELVALQSTYVATVQSDSQTFGVDWSTRFSHLRDLEIVNRYHTVARETLKFYERMWFLTEPVKTTYLTHAAPYARRAAWDLLESCEFFHHKWASHIVPFFSRPQLAQLEGLIVARHYDIDILRVFLDPFYRSLVLKLEPTYSRTGACVKDVILENIASDSRPVRISNGYAIDDLFTPSFRVDQSNPEMFSRVDPPRISKLNVILRGDEQTYWQRYIFMSPYVFAARTAARAGHLTAMSWDDQQFIAIHPRSSDIFPEHLRFLHMHMRLDDGYARTLWPTREDGWQATHLLANSPSTIEEIPGGVAETRTQRQLRAKASITSIFRLYVTPQNHTNDAMVRLKLHNYMWRFLRGLPDLRHLSLSMSHLNTFYLQFLVDYQRPLFDLDFDAPASDQARADRDVQLYTSLHRQLRYPFPISHRRYMAPLPQLLDELTLDFSTSARVVYDNESANSLPTNVANGAERIVFENARARRDALESFNISICKLRLVHDRLGEMLTKLTLIGYPYTSITGEHLRPFTRLKHLRICPTPLEVIYTEEATDRKLAVRDILAYGALRFASDLFDDKTLVGEPPHTIGERLVSLRLDRALYSSMDGILDHRMFSRSFHELRYFAASFNTLDETVLSGAIERSITEMDAVNTPRVEWAFSVAGIARSMPRLEELYLFHDTLPLPLSPHRLAMVARRFNHICLATIVLKGGPTAERQGWIHFGNTLRTLVVQNLAVAMSPADFLTGMTRLENLHLTNPRLLVEDARHTTGIDCGDADIDGRHAHLSVDEANQNDRARLCVQMGRRSHLRTVYIETMSRHVESQWLRDVARCAGGRLESFTLVNTLARAGEVAQNRDATEAEMLHAQRQAPMWINMRVDRLATLASYMPNLQQFIYQTHMFVATSRMLTDVLRHWRKLRTLNISTTCDYTHPDAEQRLIDNADRSHELQNQETDRIREMFATVTKIPVIDMPHLEHLRLCCHLPLFFRNMGPTSTRTGGQFAFESDAFTQMPRLRYVDVALSRLNAQGSLYRVSRLDFSKCHQLQEILLRHAYSGNVDGGISTSDRVIRPHQGHTITFVYDTMCWNRRFQVIAFKQFCIDLKIYKPLITNFTRYLVELTLEDTLWLDAMENCRTAFESAAQDVQQLFVQNGRYETSTTRLYDDPAVSSDFEYAIDPIALTARMRTVEGENDINPIDFRHPFNVEDVEEIDEVPTSLINNVAKIIPYVVEDAVSAIEEARASVDFPLSIDATHNTAADNLVNDEPVNDAEFIQGVLADIENQEPTNVGSDGRLLEVATDDLQNAFVERFVRTDRAIIDDVLFTIHDNDDDIVDDTSDDDDSDDVNNFTDNDNDSNDYDNYDGHTSDSNESDGESGGSESDSGSDSDGSEIISGQPNQPPG